MNQEDCDIMLEKGVEVKIYPRGNPEMECEGIAKLIECVEVQKTREKWLVKFKDEHRLLKRFLRKPQQVEAPPDPKMNKQIVNGKIRYFYTTERTSRKSILGTERMSHSETKYQYKKARRRKN